MLSLGSSTDQLHLISCFLSLIERFHLIWLESLTALCPVRTKLKTPIFLFFYSGERPMGWVNKKESSVVAIKRDEPTLFDILVFREELRRYSWLGAERNCNSVLFQCMGGGAIFLGFGFISLIIIQICKMPFILQGTCFIWVPYLKGCSRGQQMQCLSNLINGFYLKKWAPWLQWVLNLMINLGFGDLGLSKTRVGRNNDIKRVLGTMIFSATCDDMA